MHWLLLSLNIQNALGSHRLPKKMRCLTPLTSRSLLPILKNGYIGLFLSIRLTKEIFVAYKVFLDVKQYCLKPSSIAGAMWNMLNINIHWAPLPKITLWNRWLAIGLWHFSSNWSVRGTRYCIPWNHVSELQQFLHSVGKKSSFSFCGLEN